MSQEPKATRATEPTLSSSEITQLLRAWSAGEEMAQEKLWPLLYGELKILARSVRRRHGGMAVRGPKTTTLVHEAYLRLLGSGVSWQDRRHFFGLASRAMRYVMVDEARRRLAKKREAEDGAAELPEEIGDPSSRRPEEILAVHQALARLRKMSPRQEKLVELRYFAGMTVEEAAEVLDVSPPTVKRDWKAARAWLYGELQSRSGGGASLEAI